MQAEASCLYDKRQSEHHDNRRVIQELNQTDQATKEEDTGSLRLSYVRMHGVDDESAEEEQNDATI